jgi:hypothetical protein
MRYFVRRIIYVRWMGDTRCACGIMVVTLKKEVASYEYIDNSLTDLKEIRSMCAIIILCGWNWFIFVPVVGECWIFESMALSEPAFYAVGFFLPQEQSSRSVNWVFVISFWYLECVEGYLFSTSIQSSSGGRVQAFLGNWNFWAFCF